MRKGFTLVEILVYVAVLAIVVGAVFSFLLWAAQSQIEASSKRRATLEGSKVLELIAKEVREATSVYISTSVFGSNPGQLSLKTQKSVPTGEQETFVDFFVCETRLCMKKESQNPLALTSLDIAVDNLVFSRVVSGVTSSLQVKLTLSSKGNQASFTETFVPRRYEQ